MNQQTMAEFRELSAKEVIRLLCHPGAWFRFPKAFMKHLSDGECILLGEFFSQIFRNKIEDSPEEWFECSVKTIKDELFYEDDKQDGILKKLKSKGLVEVEKRGFPSTRWIRPNYDAILNLMAQERGAVTNAKPLQISSPGLETLSVDGPAQSGSGDPHCTIYAKKQNKELSRPSPKGRDVPLGGGFFGNPEDLKIVTLEEMLAQKLYAGLNERGKITKRPRISAWAAEIQKFFGTSKYTLQEFEETLDEYLNRINEEYMPIAYCAASFCEKFPKIRNALRRKNSSSGFDDQAARVQRMLQGGGVEWR